MAQARAKNLLSVGLAERLRQTRERAGLSQLELSRQAGLGKMTASDIEAGRRNQVNVGIGTVERLARVLNVPASFLAYGEEATHALHIKDWMAPGFDPLKMVRELATQVNGSGGHIEQSYKYLDAMDADNWCAFTKQARYASFIEGVPITRAADARHPLLESIFRQQLIRE
jgi:transcriptional regulator with XRE-family HTH domain